MHRRTLAVGSALFLVLCVWTMAHGEPVENVKNTKTNETFATIQAAIDAASAGDTIEVMAGLYEEDLTIQTESLTLVGAQGAKVGHDSYRNDHDDESVIDAGGSGTVITITADNVTVRGFTVRNASMTYDSKGDEGSGITIKDASDCTVENNIIHGNVVGVVIIAQAGNATNNRVIGNDIYDNVLRDANDKIEVTGDGVDRGQGVRVRQDSGRSTTGTVIENNHVRGSKSGLKFSRPTEVLVRGNAIYNNYHFGIETYVSHENTFEGNTIYNNGIIGLLTDDDCVGPDNITDTQGARNSAGVRLGGSQRNEFTANDIYNDATGGQQIKGFRLSDSADTLPEGNIIHHNAIYGHDEGEFRYGIHNIGYSNKNPADADVDARYNWWGDASGPYHDGTNLDGKANRISDNVSFEPWAGGPVVNKTVDGDGTVDAEAQANTEVLVTGSGTVAVTVWKYPHNPTETSFGNAEAGYIDVLVPSVTDVTEIEIRLHYDPAAVPPGAAATLRMYWWDGEDWVPCSDQGVDTDGDYIWAKIRKETTTPTLADLTNTVFGAGTGEPTRHDNEFTGSGWHLLSVPVVGADQGLSAVFASIPHERIVRVWDGTKYVEPQAIDPGRGYWVYLFGTVEIVLEHPNPTGDYAVELTDSGWHQISTPKWPVSWQSIRFSDGGGEKDVTEAFAAGWIQEYAYRWERTAGDYVHTHLPSTTLPLEPWVGYWIKTEQANLTMTVPLDEQYIPSVPAGQAWLRTRERPTGLTPPPPPQRPSTAGTVHVTAYPNPLSQQGGIVFRAAGPSAQAMRVMVMDLSGGVVFRGEVEGSQLAWDVTGRTGQPVANGVYLFAAHVRVGGRWISTPLGKLMILR